MKEIKKENLKVGDTVYVPRNIPFSRFTYYSKETIIRISPKRTKVVTDRCEYDRYNKFFLEDDELLRKDEVARAYEKIIDTKLLIHGTRLKDIADEKLLALAEHMVAIEKILKEDKE